MNGIIRHISSLSSPINGGTDGRRLDNLPSTCSFYIGIHVLAEQAIPRHDVVIDRQGFRCASWIVSFEREITTGDGRSWPMDRVGYLRWLAGRIEGYGEEMIEPIKSLVEDGYVEIVDKPYNRPMWITDEGRAYLASHF
jgi:hypothetical protein